MSVTLTKIPNPFNPEINIIEVLDFVDGKTLDHYISDLPLHDPDINFVLAVNGGIVTASHNNVVIFDGDKISAVAKTEATVAGVVAAWVVGAVGATSLAAYLVYGVTFLATMFVIGYGVSALASALGPDGPDAQGGGGVATEPTYGWGSLRQTTGEGTQIPYIFGACKVSGHVLNQYVLLDGNNEYLNVLFGICDHQIDSITDVRINDQPVSYFKGITTYTDRIGSKSDALIPGFGFAISQKDIGSKLIYNDPIEFTSEGNQVEALKVFLTFPRGLYYSNDQGSLDVRGVGVNIEYRLNGAPSWIFFGNFYFEGQTTETIRKSIDINYGGAELTPGTYDVRVTRTTADATSHREVLDMYLSAIQELIVEDLAYPGLAKYAVKALATDQLSNGMPSFSCLASRMTISVWDEDIGGFDSKRATNPAWICWILLNQYAGIYADRIIWEDFKEWADYCDEDVSTSGGPEYRIAYAVVVQRGNFWDEIQRIARLGRAAVIRRGVRYGVFIDKYEGASPTVSHLFTMGNIIDETFNLQYLPQKDRANAIEIEYTDYERDYTRQVVTVYSDDYLASDQVSQPAKVSIQASCTQKMAVREGIFRINSNKYLSRTVTFEADIDSFACVVGDLFYFQHEMVDYGTDASGRIVSATSTSVTLDRQVVIVAGQTYKIMVRLGDGTLVEKTVTNSASTTDVLTVSAFATLPVQYDVYMFGRMDTYKKIYRLVSVTRADDFTRAITGLEYVPEIYTDNDGYMIEEITQPEWMEVENVQRAHQVAVNETDTYAADGSYVTALMVAWSPKYPQVSNKWSIWLEDMTGGFEMVGNTSFTGTGGALAGGGGSLVGTLPDDWSVWSAGTVTTTRNADGTITVASTAITAFYTTDTVATTNGKIYRLDTEVTAVSGTIEASIRKSDYSKILFTEEITAPGLYHFSGTEVNQDNMVVLFHIPAGGSARFKFANAFQEGVTANPVKVATTSNLHIRLPDPVVTGHFYRVYVAVDGSGPVDTGQNTDTITIAGVEAPPDDVQNFYGEWDSIHRVVNTIWDHVTNLDFNHYEIREGAIWETAIKIGETADNACSVPVDEGTTETVTYLLKAFDRTGNESDSAASITVDIDTTDTELTAPTGLTVSSSSNIGSDGTDTVLMLISCDTNAELSDYFYQYIFRVEDKTSGKVSQYKTQHNEHQLPLLPNHGYGVSVAAMDKSGNSTDWATEVLHTTTKDTAAPAAPTSLTATATFTSLILTWSHGAEADLDHFLVYRHTSNDSGAASRVGQAVREFSGTLGMLQDTPPTVAAYYYWVKAVDTSGNPSAFSAVASGTPGQVDEDHLAADSVTAVKINVTDLSAISANVGTITAGYLRNSTGTTYLDLDDGTMSIGGVLTWNGSVLSVGSSASINAGAISTGRISGSASGSYWDLDTNKMHFASTGQITFVQSDQQIYGDSVKLMIEAGSNRLHLSRTGNITLAAANPGAGLTLQAAAGILIDAAAGVIIEGSSGATLRDVSGNKIECSAGGVLVTSSGSTDDIKLDSNSNVILDSSTAGGLYYRMGGSNKILFGSNGIYPDSSVSGSLSLGSYPSYLWHHVNADGFYDNGVLLNDEFEDLYEMSQFKARKDKDGNSVRNAQGVEYMDMHSLPRRITNYDELVLKLKEDNYDMMTDADIEEFLLDYDEAGYMIGRGLGDYGDLLSGGVRELDIESKEIYELIFSRLTAVENKVKTMEV